jgi:chlorite dismutase
MADNEGMTGKPNARELNELIRYTMWSVFRVQSPGALEAAGAESRGGRDGLAAEVSELCQQASGKGVVTRGCYDVQGLRADAGLRERVPVRPLL